MKCPDCGHPDTSHNDAGCFHDDGGPPCFCRASGESIRFPEEYEPKEKHASEDAFEVAYTPFLNCGWKSVEDGTCSHPGQWTPECHQFCCPIKAVMK